MTPKQSFKKAILWGAPTMLLFGLLSVTGLALYLNPQLPQVDTLKNIQLQTPLKVYSSDLKLIAEFGEKRRTPINIVDVPPLFIKAVLAAEDDGFLSHGGVDIKGLMRAALQLVTTGHIQTGGSTITMQVAKNYFLSQERTFSRKFNEILLALQIEKALGKQQILELYLNKIYLGNRAYGIQAAAEVYYGKNIQSLDLAQLAMIAGLPKAPSSYNPLANPERALIRRNWILSRMLKLKYIDQDAYNGAVSQSVTAKYHGLQRELDASYLAEMVRSDMLGRYTEEQVYTSGMRVYTTLNSKHQHSANVALERGLLAYDNRHGYRGAENTVTLEPETPIESAVRALESSENIGPLHPAVVLKVEDQIAEVILKNNETVEIQWPGLEWARKFINTDSMGPKPANAADILKSGDQIRIIKKPDNTWALSQLPIAQSALVSLNPKDGAILSLVGGFNFQQSKFNRVTQATRQPGSNFKPFIYTAALEYGYTAASIINDAPVIFDDPLLENVWRPENYSGKFYGPTRVRQALYLSRNLVSIRLLRALSIPKTIDFVSRFGFDKKRLPNDLSLALGSAEFTPLEIATGYASLANGGYKVEPYFIDKIYDNDNNLLFQEAPLTVCPDCEGAPWAKIKKPGNENELSKILVDSAGVNIANSNILQLKAIQLPETLKKKTLPAPRIIEERIAYIINSMLQDVIKRGTGRAALALGRSDMAGKTGTTNDQTDAWFSGYNSEVVATAWIGFDQPQTLGRREYGGSAALPIWIDYMREVLAGSPELHNTQPQGLVSIRIDPKTGLRARPGQSDAIFELFRSEHVPLESAGSADSPIGGSINNETVPEQLF